MVVIGHSQGGLLTKMSAVAVGQSLEVVSDPRIDELDMDEEVKDLARRMFFFEPLPEVTRVVFISTPPGEFPDQGLGAERGQDVRDYPRRSGYL